jgi:hypothetical protein
MTRARELAKFGRSDAIAIVGANDFVGVGSETPDRQLDVGTGDLVVGAAITLGGLSGIVSATEFHGDGSNLTNPIAGLSTTGFSTFKEAAFSGIASVTNTTAATSSSTGALVVSGGVGIAKSLFVDGGISVAGTITYNDVTNVDSIGIVTAGKGLRATTGGLVVTAGNVKVTAGIVTVGAGLTLSSDFIHLGDNKKIQLGIASDLAIYHDGTNSYISNGTGDLRIDPKSGERGITLAADGAATLYHDNSAKLETVGTGLSVYGGLKIQSGFMRENVNITAGKLSANTAINLDNGMIHYFTTQETATSAPNIISGAGINTDMAIGDSFTITVITTAAAAAYSTNWRIDGVEASSGVTTSWNGGSAPDEGGSSGKDMYTMTFMKTANAAYTLLGNLNNYA